MLERMPRGKRILVLLAIGALVLLAAWSIRAVLNPLLLGYLVAFVLHPMVRALDRRGLTRRASVNVIYALSLVLGVLLSLGLALQVRSLAVDVTTDENLRGRVQERVDAFEEGLRGWFGEENVPDLGELPDLSRMRELAREFLSEHGQAVQAAGRAGIEAAGHTAGFLAALLGKILAIAGLFVLVPIYSYYFLFELERIHRFLKRHLPLRDRERLADVGTQIGAVVASFFRGRLGVCLLKGMLLSVGLWVAGIDYPFLFGMVSGFLSIVPFFGPFLGFLGAALIGVLEHGVLGSLVRTGVVFGAAELFEGYVLIPKVLGDRLGLHPMVVIFSLLAGGAALGMLGVLVALPVTATLVIVTREFVLPALEKTVDQE